MPKRHTVSSFTNVSFHTYFAVKRLLNGFDSVLYIAIFWTFLICMSGYWYRSVELDACYFDPSRITSRYMSKKTPKP
jgi:hypothetical protein